MDEEQLVIKIEKLEKIEIEDIKEVEKATKKLNSTRNKIKKCRQEIYKLNQRPLF